MNNTRRKAIKQTIDRFDSIRKKLEELVSEIESVKSDVEDIQWEEEEYRGMIKQMMLARIYLMLWMLWMI